MTGSRVSNLVPPEEAIAAFQSSGGEYGATRAVVSVADDAVRLCFGRASMDIARTRQASSFYAAVHVPVATARSLRDQLNELLEAIDGAPRT